VQYWADRAKRLLIPLLSLFADVPDSGSENSDGQELRVFGEEYVELLYDFGSENDQ
jgi:hypothetical protein